MADTLKPEDQRQTDDVPERMKRFIYTDDNAPELIKKDDPRAGHQPGNVRLPRIRSENE